MSIKQVTPVSFGERKTGKLLKKYDEHIKIYPRVLFFDVFERDINCTRKEHEYLEKTYFDFVIGEPEAPYKFLFAVEFDDIQEDYKDIDPHRKIKKETKNKICRQEKFPLLRIGYKHIENFDGETILDAILDSYIYGKEFDKMREAGAVACDETYLYDFKSLHILLQKYRSSLMSIRSEIPEEKIIEMTEPGGKIKLMGIIDFNTEKGVDQIRNFVVIEAIDFPHFYSLEFAEDFSKYLCLKELDIGISKGKYRFGKIRE